MKGGKEGVVEHDEGGKGGHGRVEGRGCDEGGKGEHGGVEGRG